MILLILRTAHHQVFQHSCVRPSTGCYPRFSLPMGSSRGFASTRTNLVALFRLAFASAPCQRHLTWLVRVTRRIIMQKARCQAFRGKPRHSPPTAGRHGVSGSFPPLVGVLFIFRSRYCSLSVTNCVLSLAGWAPRIHARFRVTGATQDTSRAVELSSTGLSPAVVRLSRRVRLTVRLLTEVLQPRKDVSLRFGLIRFRSPLLTESRFLSSPPATKMFQFAGLTQVSRDQRVFNHFPELFAVCHARVPVGA